jgi:uncharacterized protein (DUF433 family)
LSVRTFNQEMRYPYITSDPGISRGTAIIEGTRITVRCIVGYYQMGMTVDEILGSLSHLTPSQVHSALVFYFDHQKEIDQEIEANNNNVSLWESQSK